MAFAMILAVAAFVSAEEKKEDQDLNTAEGSSYKLCIWCVDNLI